MSERAETAPIAINDQSEPLRWFTGELKDQLLRGCERVDLDVRQLCDAVGLRYDQVQQRSYRIRLKHLTLLMDRAAYRLGTARLGLLLASRTPLGGTIHTLMIAQNSVGEALRMLAEHHAAVLGSRSVHMNWRDDELFIALNVGPRPHEHRWVSEYCVALLTRYLHWMTGGAVVPKECRFRHERSAPEPEHERYFSSPVRFDAEETALVLTAASWRAPVGFANSRLAHRYDRVLRAQCEAAAEQSLQERVKEALRHTALRRRDCARRAVARLLSTSERTLQRRLIAEGTTFSEIVAAMRRELALVLVLDDERSVHEISELLGFADQSSFNKTFRRWTGHSPSSYRRQCGQ